MKEIFTITNQKGGIGKSTTAHAIGAGLARKQNKTLLVDLDAQANLTLAAGADPSRPTILELMQQTAAAGDVIQPVRENLDILPASMNLSAADLLFHDTGKEYRLKEALAPLLGQYDYLVLDTPPALGVLTVNALTVATKVIIPAQADLFSLSAIQRLYGTIETVKKYTNPSLQNRRYRADPLQSAQHPDQRINRSHSGYRGTDPHQGIPNPHPGSHCHQRSAGQPHGYFHLCPKKQGGAGLPVPAG